MSEQLLSVKDVAALYRINPKTVWRWVREGRMIPPIKITPRVVRWPANARLMMDARLYDTEDYRKLP